MELSQGQATRARAKKMKERDGGINNGLLALAEELVNEGLKLKIEG